MRKTKRLLPKILRHCALAAILIVPASQTAFSQSSDIDFADTDGGTGASSGNTGGSGGKARTITVNPSSGSTRTIQNAINKSRAGDTIIVKPGVYRESLSIKHSLTIRSESGSNSSVEIIAPTDKPCVRSKPSRTARVAISNVSLRTGSGYTNEACVDVSSGFFSLKNSKVKGTDDVPAVRLRGGVVQFQGNAVTGGRIGVLVEGSKAGSEFFILDNDINGNRNGIRIEGPASVNLAGNIVRNSKENGIVNRGGGGTMIGNDVHSNGQNGLILNEGNLNPLIKANRIFENGLDAIYVPLAATGRIFGNQIYKNGGQCVHLGQGKGPKVDDNICEGNSGDKSSRRRGGFFD